MSVGARDVERQNASIRVALAIGDLVVLDGFRDVLAGSQVFRQRVGEFAIRLDVEDAMIADNVGNSVEAALGADVGAIELTEEELAVVASNVVVQDVAADDAAFVEAVVVVDSNR